MRTVVQLLIPCVLAFAGCGDDSERDADVAPAPSDLAVGTLGPQGGTLEVTQGDYAGTELRVLPGALAAPVEFRIRRDPRELPPNVWAFSFEPASTVFALPVGLSLKYSRAYLDDFLLPNVPGVDLRPVSIGGLHGSEVYETIDRDFDERVVGFETTTLGRFAVLLEDAFGGQYRAFIQDRALVTSAFVREVDGERLVVSGSRPGAASVAVGKGDPAAFWSSGRALILVHATAADATQFVGPDDLVVGLDAEFDAVAVYQYRSGRPIAENGAWLYNEIKAKAQPGFRADLIAYSMGGLVARCCIERAKDDPLREALGNFDPVRSAGPLSSLIGNLVTLGSPHQGAVEEARAQFLGVSALLDLAVVDDYFPSLQDLSGGAGGVGPQLNAAYVDDPAIRYFLVAGGSNDGTLSPIIPGDDDGLVSVDSALGVPGLAAPEAALAFPPAGDAGYLYSHPNLHAEAVPNGIRDRIVAWIRPPPT